MKATAWAPVNLALIKYWGKKDKDLNLPWNSSISVNLSSLYTITTVEFSKKYRRDTVIIDGEKKKNEVDRVIQHIERIRSQVDTEDRVKIVTRNNFPKGTGIASSASGFAALTLAATSALNLKLSEKDLSTLARLGSGSACRSIPSGFVEWKKGDKNNSYAKTIFSKDHWSIRIATIILDEQPKEISSTQGHLLALSNPFFKVRLKNINKKIIALKQAIKNKDFINFGKIIEQETLEMHAIMMTSNPPLLYFSGNTVFFIKKIFLLRKKRLPVFFTLDAGPNLHLFFLSKNEKQIKKVLDEDKNIKKYYISEVATGAHLVSDHLF